MNISDFLSQGNPYKTVPKHNKFLNSRNRIDSATGVTNKQLTQAGSAPYANDGTKIELHHLLQQEPGPMVEIPASLHDKYYRTLHGLVGDGEQKICNYKEIHEC